MTKRMLARVRLAAFEIEIKLRQAIRSPMKNEIQNIGKAWSEILDVDIVDKVSRLHQGYNKQLRDVIYDLQNQ